MTERLQDAVYYGSAALVFVVAVGIDHIRTDQTRDDAATANAAAEAAAITEQEAAEERVGDALRSDHDVRFIVGRFEFTDADEETGAVCLFNPLVDEETGLVMMIGRTDPGDPDSLRVLAVGTLRDIDAQGKPSSATTTPAWDPARNAFVATGGGPYNGLAIGAGLPMPADQSMKC